MTMTADQLRRLDTIPLGFFSSDRHWIHYAGVRVRGGRFEDVDFAFQGHPHALDFIAAGATLAFATQLAAAIRGAPKE